MRATAKRWRSAGAALAIDRGHARLVVAGTRSVWNLGVDAREVLLAQLDVERGGVLFQVSAALGPGDRNHVLTLRQHPRQGELRRRDPLGAGELRDLLRELLI